jgi:hypothetical protein
MVFWRKRNAITGRGFGVLSVSSCDDKNRGRLDASYGMYE